MARTRDAEAELNLPPGFRFHPTDEELVVHYLCRKAAHQHLPITIIAEVDLYKFNPWELPDKALLGRREWYFFTPLDRKYPNGSRPNRAAGKGYWKATGADKPVSVKGSNRPLGIKKALVFYSGKAPNGVKTDWIMHEYRLANTSRSAIKNGSLRQLDEWVLCRLYNKKKAWEKTQQNKKEPESFGEAAGSMDVEDTVISDSLRTPESDGDDCFPGFDERGNKPVVQMASGNVLSFHGADQQHPKEGNDWFLDLNLDELEDLGITSMATNGEFDVPLYQDYFF